MPLVLTQQNSDSKLLIWRITEDLDFFLDKLSSSQLLDCEEFVWSERKLEYACSRALISDAFANSTLLSKENGAPFFEDSTLPTLSISHTDGYVAVMFSNKKQASVDIEITARDVSKVKNRYLSVDELTYKTDDRFEIISWCAKECAYKFLQKENIDWLKDMKIIGFDLDKKTIKLCLLNTKILELNFKFFDDLTIVHI